VSGGQINLPMMFNRVGVPSHDHFLLPFMILSILGSLLAQDRTLILRQRPWAPSRCASSGRSRCRSACGRDRRRADQHHLVIGMYITPACSAGGRT